MTHERLIEVGLTDSRWEDDARWAVHGNWDLALIAEEEAVRLQAAVLDRTISVQELRGGVTWANALDSEAVRMYGADLNQGSQQAERAARRLMHIAGRSALKGVRNERLRTLATSKATTLTQLPGMGNLETHDIKDRDLVQ